MIGCHSINVHDLITNTKHKVIYLVIIVMHGVKNNVDIFDKSIGIYILKKWLVNQRLIGALLRLPAASSQPLNSPPVLNMFVLYVKML